MTAINVTMIPAELQTRFAEFWEGYTQAVGFTAIEDADEYSGQLFPCQGDFGESWPDVWNDFSAHLSDAERQEMLDDASGFFMESQHLIEGRDEKAGTDFHFTRNGHGAGFWDGDWDRGNELTAIAKVYGSLELIGTVDENAKMTSCYLCH